MTVLQGGAAGAGAAAAAAVGPGGSGADRGGTPSCDAAIDDPVVGGGRGEREKKLHTAYPIDKPALLVTYLSMIMAC